MTVHRHDAAPRLGRSRDAARVVRRAVVLNRMTLGYNAVEAVVALAAGVVAGSISLIGFGLDSVVEVAASLILMWRLAAERRDGCTQEADFARHQGDRDVVRGARRVRRHRGVSATAVGRRTRQQRDRRRPRSVSLLVMPFLARAKRRVAPGLGSRAQVAEANQTALCALMSAVVLVGLGTNAALGWWWADPVAGLAIAALAAVEAVRTWRAESLEDTCCA